MPLRPDRLGPGPRRLVGDVVLDRAQRAEEVAVLLREQQRSNTGSRRLDHLLWRKVLTEHCTSHRHHHSEFALGEASEPVAVLREGVGLDPPGPEYERCLLYTSPSPRD